MKLYTALVMNGPLGETYNIGIYSSPDKAVLAFHNYMEDIEIEKYDELFEGGQDRFIFYYRTTTHVDKEFEDYYNLTVEPFEVDKMNW